MHSTSKIVDSSVHIIFIKLVTIDSNNDNADKNNSDIGPT